MLFLNYNVWQYRPKNFEIRAKKRERKKTENIEQKTREYRMYNACAREKKTMKYKVQ